MRKITNELILSFKNYLIEEEKSENTVAKYVRDITFFMVWLCGQEVTKILALDYKKELCEKYAPASILYKDEAKLLDGVEDTDKVYVEQILPAKMYYNLKQIEQFSFWNDIKLMFMTMFAVLGKEYKGVYETVMGGVEQIGELVEK